MKQNWKSDEQVFRSQIGVGGEEGDVHKHELTGGEMHDQLWNCTGPADFERLGALIVLQSNLKVNGIDNHNLFDVSECGILCNMRQKVAFGTSIDIQTVNGHVYVVFIR